MYKSVDFLLLFTEDAYNSKFNSSCEKKKKNLKRKLSHTAGYGMFQSQSCGSSLPSTLLVWTLWVCWILIVSHFLFLRFLNTFNTKSSFYWSIAVWLILAVWTHNCFFFFLCFSFPPITCKGKIIHTKN